VVLLVNYSRRYSESHKELRDYIKAGHIGELQTVSGYYTKGILHNGTHWFDLARFLIGEVRQVWGQDVLKENCDDPTLDALLEFDSGINGYLHGCDAKAFSLFEMDLVGEKGRVRVVESGHTFEIYQTGDCPHATGYRSLIRTDNLSGGMHDVLLRAVEDLVHCLEEGRQPRCTGSDGVAALHIGLAVRESALSKKLRELGSTS
jgi:predicted dehydrogenase